MHLAAVLAALLSTAGPPPADSAAAPASGGAPVASTSPAASAASSPAVAPDAGSGDGEPRHKVLGLQLAAGFPEGFSASALVRPLPWLRADAGVAHNILALGIQGGLTFMPWPGSIVPTLRLGAGQFFNSDVRKRFGSTFPTALDPALQQFGYHFFEAQVGLELGNEDGAQFFLRGGLAWVSSDLRSATYTQGNTTVTADRNDLSATTPSLQLGVLWHLW